MMPPAPVKRTGTLAIFLSPRCSNDVRGSPTSIPPPSQDVRASFVRRQELARSESEPHHRAPAHYNERAGVRQYFRLARRADSVRGAFASSLVRGGFSREHARALRVALAGRALSADADFRPCAVARGFVDVEDLAVGRRMTRGAGGIVGAWTAPQPRAGSARTNRSALSRRRTSDRGRRCCACRSPTALPGSRLRAGAGIQAAAHGRALCAMARPGRRGAWPRRGAGLGFCSPTRARRSACSAIRRRRG